MDPPTSHMLVQRLRGMLGLDGVDDEVLTRIIGGSLTLRWSDSGVIAAPGDPAEALFVVMGGAVEVDGGDDPSSPLRPGATFGGREIVGGSPHDHRFAAAPECELMVIPRRPFEDLLAAAPGLADRL